jgi:RimJ/RimL family protein N-acetyltransferase
MEKMPYQPDIDRPMTVTATGAGTISSDWRNALPVMIGKRVTLRELEISDAAALFAMLTPEEVSRFISPPPTTVEGFEKFIIWARAERAAGRYACFVVVPHGMNSAVGLFQVRQLEAGFATAEWGFALGSAFWGTGMFIDGGQMVVDFAVETLNVGRLEARACVANGRGNGALRKLGAVQEGVLRRSFLKNGQFLDQMLWSILAEEWRQARAAWGPAIVH